MHGEYLLTRRGMPGGTRGLERGLRLPVMVRDVLEAGVLWQEHDLDRPDGPVPLLADDHLCDVRLVRRQVLLVDRLPGEEPDQAAVFLERATLATVGALRAILA